MNEMTIGEKIAKLRREKSMTQEELAEKLGVSAQAVSKWENNICCPDIALIPKIAQLFGVSTDMLLGSEQLRDTPKKATLENDGFQKKKSLWLKTRWEILVAAFVLLLGGSLLWNSLAEIGLGFWEVLLIDGIITVGLGAMFVRLTPFSIGLFALGIIYHLVKFNIITWADKYNSLILPAVIIILGLTILYGIFFPKKHRHKYFVNGVEHDAKTQFSASVDDGVLDFSLRFGENRYDVDCEVFKGGDIEVSFGEAVVDLTKCKTVAADATLCVKVSFGEATLVLPKHIRAVSEDPKASFGDVSHSYGTPDADAVTLVIEPKASFGAFNIKYI